MNVNFSNWKPGSLSIHNITPIIHEALGCNYTSHLFILSLYSPSKGSLEDIAFSDKTAIITID